MAKSLADLIIKQHKKFVSSFGRDFISSLDDRSLPPFSSTRKATNAIDALAAYTRSNFVRHITQSYADEQKKVRGFLRSQGISRKREDIESFKRVNEMALRILLRDPHTGFVPHLDRHLFSLRKKIKSIEAQARALLDGTLIESSSPAPDLFTSISLALFIRIPTKRGPRNLRMDKLVRQVLNDATSKSRSVAMRNKLLEHRQEYIILKVSGTSPKSPMNLYSDKVFALSNEAADALGVPHVRELPNGGVPMHPNSKMIERPWIKPADIEPGGDYSIEPPPSWALNRPFELVRSEYSRRVS